MSIAKALLVVRKTSSTSQPNPTPIGFKTWVFGMNDKLAKLKIKWSNHIACGKVYMDASLPIKRSFSSLEKILGSYYL
jgi:hypothetical protein